MKGKLIPNFWDKVSVFYGKPDTSQQSLNGLRSKIICNPQDVSAPSAPNAINTMVQSPNDFFSPFDLTSDSRAKNGINSTNPSSGEENRNGKSGNEKQSFNMPPPIQKINWWPFIIGAGIIVALYFYIKKRQCNRIAKEKSKEDNKLYPFQKEGIFDEFKKSEFGKNVLFAGELASYILLATILFLLYGELVKTISKVSGTNSK